MKALSEENPFDFSKIKILRMWVGDQEIYGDCILSVKPPLRGSPYWEVRYEIGAEVSVLYAASTPIKIEAVEIKQEQVQEKELDDDE
jgi:hypothetical protein